MFGRKQRLASYKLLAHQQRRHRSLRLQNRCLEEKLLLMLNICIGRYYSMPQELLILTVFKQKQQVRSNKTGEKQFLKSTATFERKKKLKVMSGAFLIGFFITTI